MRPRVAGGGGAAGRQFVRRTAGWRQGSYRARPAAPDRSAWEVGIDLAGDVALEDADDLALGEPLGEASLDVVAGARVASSCG